MTEELYPTDVSSVADSSSLEDLAALQQHTTEQKLAAVSRLVQWLLANHAEVNVGVREAGPGAGLGLFAVRDLQQDDTLLSLPTDLAFSRRATYGVMEFLIDYVLDMSNLSGPRGLMWATIPRPHELRHLLNFPPSYLPLLQHPQLLGTRIFNKAEADGTATFYALPLLDMANHDNACPHYNSFRPCDFDTSRECVYFTAGADVSAGQEVCFFYGHLLPDRALLEYGYLLQQTTQQQQQLPVGSSGTGGEFAVVPPLSGIDRHDADFDSEPLAKLMAEPQPFVGRSAAEVTTRISDLQQLLAWLVSGDAQAADIAAQGPAPGDESGAFLQQLLAWRQQRQQAVAAEIERLQVQLQHKTYQ